MASGSDLVPDASFSVERVAFLIGRTMIQLFSHMCGMIGSEDGSPGGGQRTAKSPQASASKVLKTLST